MQVQHASVSWENCHKSLASFHSNLEYLFDHQFLYNIIVVSFLFSSSYSAPGLSNNNNNNIFYLNTVGFKANIAYGAVWKMLTKFNVVN